MNLEGWISAEWNQWMNSTMLLMPNWKWIGLALAVIFGLLIQYVAKNAIRKSKCSPFAQSRATGFTAHFLRTDLETPLAWILTGLLWKTALDSLSVNLVLEKYLEIAVHLLLAFYIILLVYRAVEAIGKVMIDYTARTDNSIDDQLAPMAIKFLKIFVIIFGFLITVQNFGINVMSILAGLGLGGLALALAAQDTAANLFGSITILLDRPFKVGDQIKVGDTEGIIEEIGLRSTRIRSLYRSLITIPNATMAKEKIDNLGARPSNRIRNIFGLTSDTPEEKILKFVEELKAVATKIREVEADSVSVTLQAMTDFNLQIQAVFFVKVLSAPQEMGIQQQFVLDAIKAAKNIGITFAYPTTTQMVRQIPQVPPSSQSPPQNQSELPKTPSF